MLAKIARKIDHDDVGILPGKSFSDGKALVRTLIVDEDELELMSRQPEIAEGLHVEPMRFIEAGNHQCDARHAGALCRIEWASGH